MIPFVVCFTLCSALALAWALCRICADADRYDENFELRSARERGAAE